MYKWRDKHDDGSFPEAKLTEEARITQDTPCVEIFTHPEVPRALCPSVCATPLMILRRSASIAISGLQLSAESRLCRVRRKQRERKKKEM